MTQETLERFSKVMLEKCRILDHSWPDGMDRDLALIQLVIADTWILLEGGVELEVWEQALEE